VLGHSGLTPYEFTVEPFGSGVSVHLVLRCKTSEAYALLVELRDIEGVSFVSDEALTSPDE
jgi:hypothetical protein